MEFALDNVQTLKLRKAKLQSQQQAAAHGDRDAKESEEPQISGTDTNKKERKRKVRDHRKLEKDSTRNKEDESGTTVPNGNAAGARNSKRQKGNHKNKKTEGITQKENSDGRNRGGKTSNTDIGTNKTKHGKKEELGLKKRKTQNQAEAGEKVTKKRSKKNKEPVGKDVVDKLDMLIEQYKSKFSQKGLQGNDGEKKPSKQLRKWFEP